MSKCLKDYNAIPWSELLTYDDTAAPSNLRWMNDCRSGRALSRVHTKAGSVAGSVKTDCRDGYVSCSVSYLKKGWTVSRVVWILHHGYLSPDLVIDHIDGNTLNNTIENLRAVDHSINTRNKKLYKTNNSEVPGVHFSIKNYLYKGNLRIKTYATSSYYLIPNVKSSRFFSVDRYGLLPAFAMAVKDREDKMKELNILGYGYTARHLQKEQTND